MSTGTLQDSVRLSLSSGTHRRFAVEERILKPSRGVLCFRSNLLHETTNMNSDEKEIVLKQEERKHAFKQFNVTEGGFVFELSD